MITLRGMTSKTAPAPPTPVYDLDESAEDDPETIVGALFRRQDEERLLLNVRGSEFTVNLNSLERAPHSTLALIGQKWKQDSTTRRRPININRKPAFVECLLDFYDTGELHIPSDLCPSLVKNELEYWGLGCELIMPCCLGKLKDTGSTVKRIWCVHRYLSERRRFLHQCQEGWRGRLWAVLDYPESSTVAKIYAWCMCGVLTAWIAGLCLHSMVSFQQAAGGNNWTSALQIGPNGSTYNQTRIKIPKQVIVLRALDMTLLLVVSIVTLLRVVVSPSKVNYFKSPINVVEVITMILQVFLKYTVLAQRSWLYAYPVPYGVIMALRSVPMLRSVLHLRGLRIIRHALIESSNELGLLFLMILLGSVTLGLLVYAVEMGREDNPYSDILVGVWWGVITFTTVGYGDVFPVTLLGRIVGAIGAIAGILIISLPVPIIACNFSSMQDAMSITEQHMRMVEDRKRRGKCPLNVKYKGWPADEQDTTA